MKTSLVFTQRSLEAVLQHSSDLGWLQEDGPCPEGLSVVARVKANQAHFLIHRDDAADASRVVIMLFDSTSPLEMLPLGAWHVALQRVLQFARAVDRPPLRLPPNWSEFHYENLVAFFACPHSLGNARWISEVHPAKSNDVCLWQITDNKNEISLQTFKPDPKAYLAAVADWNRAVENAKLQFPSTPALVPIDGVIDLEAATYRAVVGRLTYTRWLSALTPEQRRFVEHPVDQPVKLRGPGGSGKTLALELKALREVYAARESKKTVRVLFATHSWAMAEQVDAALRALDESGSLEEFSVFPLTEVTRSILPAERRASDADLVLLGEDGLTGRRLQLQRINEALARLKKSDWLAYRKSAGPEFCKRMEAEEHSPARNSLVWDLMHEFGSVLAAASILPGIMAEKKYLALRRAPWMMPLNREAEKKFVLRVYGEYIAELKADKLLTSDQLVNDFLSYLETFAWDYRRSRDGFDMIFVDELHLFSDQERLAINYLARDASRFPRMFMALDPRQAPSEVYADFPVEEVGSTDSQEPDQSLGTVDAVDLTTVHRFSPQILELVKYIHNSYPALEFGADWVVDVAALRSAAKDGKAPSLYRHGTARAELVEALKHAALRVRNAASGTRVAVVLVDSLRLPEFVALATADKMPFVLLESRDDIESLRYARRSVVISAAEYVAGLQFDEVVVAGFPVDPGAHVSPHERRRLLSQLYLAVSRASRDVEINIHGEIGDFASFFEPALKSGVVVAVEG